MAFAAWPRSCANASACFGGLFDIPGLKQELAELGKRAESPDFWDNPEEAQKVMQRRAQLERRLADYEKAQEALDNALTLFELAQQEEDEEAKQEAAHELLVAEQRIEQLEVLRMLSGEHDRENAFLEITAGAGGTEAQDWAEMLLRMYLRWAEKKGFKTEIVELTPGEEAGIKSATVRVIGEYAYGYLKAEVGVHRLVRKSPFDAGHRRHTSFASVFVYPDIDREIKIEIQEKDLKIETFRAQGPGGQHVNKTESAVRITHIPTGIVVKCQSERSQHKNRAMAMKMLKARLYEYELRKREAEKRALEEQKPEIAWGRQIRSYVLDQSRIKDLRTGMETGNTQAFLDGEIDDFIYAQLMGLRKGENEKARA